MLISTYVFFLLSRAEMLYGWLGSRLLGATDDEILNDVERLVLVYASYLDLSNWLNNSQMRKIRTMYRLEKNVILLKLNIKAYRLFVIVTNLFLFYFLIFAHTFVFILVVFISSSFFFLLLFCLLLF